MSEEALLIGPDLRLVNASTFVMSMTFMMRAYAVKCYLTISMNRTLKRSLNSFSNLFFSSYARFSAIDIRKVAALSRFLSSSEFSEERSLSSWSLAYLLVDFLFAFYLRSFIFTSTTYCVGIKIASWHSSECKFVSSFKCGAFLPIRYFYASRKAFSYTR